MFNTNNFRFFCLQNFPFIEKDIDGLTDYQILCRIFEYFDRKIKEVDNKYGGLFESVEKLTEDFEQLKIDINKTLENFENRITLKVEEKLQQNYDEVIQLLNNYQILFNYQINNLREELIEKIENIELGNVVAYNPTNGLTENVSKVITDVYETLRNNAISCSEFDSLMLTATEFDSKELTAYDFDVNGKIMLIPA